MSEGSAGFGESPSGRVAGVLDGGQHGAAAAGFHLQPLDSDVGRTAALQRRAHPQCTAASRGAGDEDGGRNQASRVSGTSLTLAFSLVGP